MKLAIKIVLAFTIAMIILGCGSLYPPARKAWVQVDSPPTRTIVVCDASDITPSMIRAIITDTKRGKFQNYQFNPSTNIGLNAVGSDIRSNTSSSTVNVN